VFLLAACAYQFYLGFYNSYFLTLVLSPYFVALIVATIHCLCLQHKQADPCHPLFRLLCMLHCIYSIFVTFGRSIPKRTTSSSGKTLVRSRSEASAFALVPICPNLLPLEQSVVWKVVELPIPRGISTFHRDYPAPCHSLISNPLSQTGTHPLSIEWDSR